MFFIFPMFFCTFLISCFVVVKTKTYKITNIMHFSWSKTPFPGHSECLIVAVLLTSCQKSCRILDFFRPLKF